LFTVRVHAAIAAGAGAILIIVHTALRLGKQAPALGRRPRIGQGQRGARGRAGRCRDMRPRRWFRRGRACTRRACKQRDKLESDRVQWSRRRKVRKDLRRSAPVSRVTTSRQHRSQAVCADSAPRRAWPSWSCEKLTLMAAGHGRWRKPANGSTQNLNTNNRLRKLSSKYVEILRWSTFQQCCC
jgi:hypothetical protein